MLGGRHRAGRGGPRRGGVPRTCVSDDHSPILQVAVALDTLSSLSRSCSYPASSRCFPFCPLTHAPCRPPPAIISPRAASCAPNPPPSRVAGAPATRTPRRHASTRFDTHRHARLRGPRHASHRHAASRLDSQPSYYSHRLASTRIECSTFDCDRSAGVLGDRVPPFWRAVPGCMSTMCDLGTASGSGRDNLGLIVRVGLA